MMKYVLFSLFPLTVLFFAPSANAQKVWTLEDCISHAHENNLQIRQQRLSAELSGEQLVVARGSRLPSLNGTASHNYGFGRSVNPFTNESSQQNNRTNSFGLSSGVTLFNGFQVTNSIKQSQVQVEASLLDVEATKNDIALRIAAQYLLILFNEEQLTIANNQVALTQQQVDRTARLVSAGSVARSAQLEIEAQLASEELLIVNAQNQLNLAQLGLKQLLLLDADAELEISRPDIVMDAEPKIPATANQVFLAAGSLPQIQSAELGVESAQYGLNIAKGRRLPTLSMSAGINTFYTTSGMRLDTNTLDLVPIPFGDQINDGLSQSLSLGLTVPIFNRFSVSSGISQANIRIMQADLQLQQARNQLRSEIEQAHADAIAALNSYKATEKSLTAVTEAFEYARKQFEVGLVNAVQFNEAKTRLQRTESELLRSKYDYVFKTKILDFYQGTRLKL